MKKYNIIYADPPWNYNDKRTWKGKNNPNWAGWAEKHYKTMTLDNICDLPIKDILADNCMLFLWATWPNIFQAEKVIKSWGFEYEILTIHYIKWEIDNVVCDFAGNKWDLWEFKTSELEFID